MDSNTEKILVVDDNDDIRALLELLFMHHGYECETASSTDEAQQTFMHTHTAGGRYRALIVDVSMPKLTGFEFVEYVREQEQLRHTKIIMLTGLNDFYLESSARQAGADHLLHKPVEPGELLALV